MSKPPLHPGLAACLLGLWCAGCSGTPWGEQLAERLSEPDDPVAETGVPNAAAATTPAEEPLTEPDPPSEPEAPEEDDPEAGISPSPPNPAAPAPAADTPVGSPNTARTPITSPQPLNPTPYRLRLRLPAADPAAPAEAVTRALRAAGILFEVEAIERLPTAAPVDPSP